MGLVSTLLVAAGSWLPSYRYGELAVLADARRPIPEAWTRWWDAAGVGHGLSAAIQRAWLFIAGDSEFAVRFPSAVAIGFAAAAVVALGIRLGSTRTGVLAGLCFVLLPRVSAMGMDAEGLALGTALISWAAFAVTRAVDGHRETRIARYGIPRVLVPLPDRRERRRVVLHRAGRWARVALLVTLATLAWPPTVLVTLAFPVLIAVLRARHDVTAERDGADSDDGTNDSTDVGTEKAAAKASSRRVTRSALAGWAMACGPLALLLIPVAVAVARARAVDWRDGVAPPSFWPWLGAVVAPGAWGWMALIPLALILIAGAWSIRRSLRERDWALPATALAWIVLPLLVTWLAAACGARVHPEYLAPVTPAVALLAGWCLGSTRVWVAAVSLGLLFAVTLPAVAGQRLTAGPHGDDGRGVANFLTERATEGDGVLLLGDDPQTHARAIAVGYPDSLRGLHDIGMPAPRELERGLWDPALTGGSSTVTLDGFNRVWIVRDTARPVLSTDPDLLAYRNQGFAVVNTVRFEAHTVYEVVRTSAFGLEPDGSLPAPPQLPPVPNAPVTLYPEPRRDGKDAPPPGATGTPGTTATPTPGGAATGGTGPRG